MVRRTWDKVIVLLITGEHIHEPIGWLLKTLPVTPVEWIDD